MKKNYLMLLAAFGLIGTSASAQGATAPSAQAMQRSAGANFTQYYVIGDLMTRPGLITLGKGGMVFLDFPDTVSAIITQSTMLDIPEPLGNLVVITSKTSTGNADLLVQLENGMYAAFRINFAPGLSSLKRIKIENAPNVETTLGANAPAPAAPVNMPIYVPQTVLSAPVAVAPANFSPITLPASSVAPITRMQPTWLGVTAQVSRAASGNTLLVTVRNSGQRALTFAPNDLTVTIGGNVVAVDVREGLTVAAGETRSYEVRLPSTIDSSSAQVEWLAHDQASNTYYRINAQ